jgi:hypothetical protein
VLVVAASRRVSSWYFGDGAVLFDQASTAVAANPVAMTAPFPGRIVALDPVLGRALSDAGAAGSVGMRVTRALTRRLRAELSVDYSLAPMRITRANRDSIEATRASFIPAFEGLITSNANRVAKKIASEAVLEDGRSRDLFTSGALLVDLTTGTRTIPFAVMGVSLMSIHGKRSSVTMTGNYQFSNTASGASFDETDRVIITSAHKARSWGAVLGAGVRYRVSRHWGVRIEGRTLLLENPEATVVDALPNVVPGQLPSGRITLNANPTIQFGNSSTPVTGLGVTVLAPSTLSGPALTGRTWTGRGVASHTNITAGVFWSF